MKKPRKAHRHSPLLACVLLLLCGVQAAFWYQTHDIEPALEIVPPPPSAASVKALSLGDDMFYFRVRTLELQNFGDTFGRFTSLRFYDFSRLSGWFYALDRLDPQSNILPTLAAHYFSQTQNKPDVRYMVDFLYDHATRDVGKKWWWLLQAIYLASYKLNDMDLALKVSQPMLNHEVPAFAQQMVAVVHEKRGEMQDALNIMEMIQKEADNFTDTDRKYMQYFIKERLHHLEELEKTGQKAQ